MCHNLMKYDLLDMLDRFNVRQIQIDTSKIRPSLCFNHCVITHYMLRTRGKRYLMFITYEVKFDTEFIGERLSTFLVQIYVGLCILDTVRTPHITGIIVIRNHYATNQFLAHGMRYSCQSGAVGITYCHPCLVVGILLLLYLIVGHSEIFAIESFLQHATVTAADCTSLKSFKLYS